MTGNAQDQVNALPLRDAASLRAFISERVAAVCAEFLKQELESVVLTGSLARDEASFRRADGHWVLEGDAEFFLVMEPGHEAPGADRVLKLRAEATQELLARGIRVQLDLTPVGRGYFKHLRPAIFAYELLACGQVVWGDPDCMKLIPRFGAADIPLEDAWRLLANRMIENLEALLEQDFDSPLLAPKTAYRTVKLYLDMATSLLVFAGAYQPGYRAREQAIRELAGANAKETDWPFPLGEFADQVQNATLVKLGYKMQAASAMEGEAPGFDYWLKAGAYAAKLWRWELCRLTGASPQLPNRQLMTQWMMRQPLPRKWRGWLVVARANGWMGSMPSWAGWASKALLASPRYWVYLAASELFFSLPGIVANSGGKLRAVASGNEQELLALLPHNPSTNDPGPGGWLRVARGIVLNYHRYLESTRA